MRWINTSIYSVLIVCQECLGTPLIRTQSTIRYYGLSAPHLQLKVHTQWPTSLHMSAHTGFHNSDPDTLEFAPWASQASGVVGACTSLPDLFHLADCHPPCCHVFRWWCPMVLCLHILFNHSQWVTTIPCLGHCELNINFPTCLSHLLGVYSQNQKDSVIGYTIFIFGAFMPWFS